MRKIFKNLTHGLVKILERMKAFDVPDTLPLRTKLAFLFGTYEKETSHFIRSHVKGDIAIDVGAHIGYYSRLLSPLVDTVYAFEPDPTNYAFLVENVKQHTNVIPLNVAISDKIDQQQFFLVKNSTFRHSLVNEGECESIMVNTTTLDNFMALKGQRVSFVKIDVEGHEQNVLAGMKNIIENYHPLIIAEMPINEAHTPVSPAIGRMGLVRNYIV